jgi:DNA modification methylase
VLKKTGMLWLNIGDSYASSWACKRRNVIGNGSPDDKTSRGRMSEGLKEKDLCGIPWRVAFALQADGWWLRQDIIWAKPNPMPESVTDRCTKSHEYLFLLTKSARYYFDAKAIAEPQESNRPDMALKGIRTGTAYIGQGLQDNSIKQKVPSGWDTDAGSHGTYHRKGRGGKTAFCGQGRERDGENGPANREGRDLVDVGNGPTRNKRSVWTIPTQAFPDAHFATFPEALVSPCVLAGCPADGIVLDPFNGAGTTGLVALKHGRSYLGIELNPAYVEMAEKRIRNECGLLLGRE